MEGLTSNIKTGRTMSTNQLQDVFLEVDPCLCKVFVSLKEVRSLCEKNNTIFMFWPCLVLAVSLK